MAEQIQANHGLSSCRRQIVQTGAVDKGAAPVGVHAENGLVGGVEKKPQLLLLPAKIGKGARAAPAEAIEPHF